MFWRRGAAALAVLFGVVTPVLANADIACAASTHHAALIVDIGNGVERRCVGFDATTISGKDVLDRANVGVVYKEYSYGPAVCSILGVGQPSSNCLGENGGGHWSYYRAAKGTSVFAVSSFGVSSTEVHDGDVEGWHWQTGVPPYSPASDVCASPAPTPTSPPPPPPAAPTPAQPVPTTARVGAIGGSTTISTDTSTLETTSTSSTVPATTSTTTRLVLPVGGDSEGGSPWALAGVGALLVGFGVAAWRISRGRAAAR